MTGGTHGSGKAKGEDGLSGGATGRRAHEQGGRQARQGQGTGLVALSQGAGGERWGGAAATTAHIFRAASYVRPSPTTPPQASAAGQLARQNTWEGWRLARPPPLRAAPSPQGCLLSERDSAPPYLQRQAMHGAPPA